MKKLIFLFLLIPTLAQAQTNQCNNPAARINVVVDISTATTTRLINNADVRSVTICSITLTVIGTATANTLIFKTGTGTTCQTGTSTISGTYTGPATAGVALVFAFIQPFGKLVDGDSFCVTTSQAGVVAGNLVYAFN